MYRVRRDRLRRQVERSIVRAERSELHADRAALRSKSKGKAPPSHKIIAGGVKFAAHNNGDP
jgi:hypothetical protein